jgi:hypothetical protein
MSATRYIEDWELEAIPEYKLAPILLRFDEISSSSKTRRCAQLVTLIWPQWSEKQIESLEDQHVETLFEFSKLIEEARLRGCSERTVDLVIKIR